LATRTVNEKTHTALVESHLIPLVQALGQIAQEAYYKTIAFQLSSDKKRSFKYPRFGQWVQHLVLHLDVDVPGHADFKGLRREDPERWLLCLTSDLRYLLRYQKPLDATRRFCGLLGRSIDFSTNQHIPGNKKETQWQVNFPNLSSLGVWLWLL
jgi:hypothetical protein